MPVIRNRIERNIPEQVAKNTADILALKGGYDYSQSPFLGADWEYNEDDSEIIITLHFIKNVVPVLVAFDFVLNDVEGQIILCLQRRSGAVSFEVNYEEISDIDATYSSFDLTNVGDSDSTDLKIHLGVSEEPYDRTEFKRLNSAQYLLLQGEIDQ